MFTTFIKKIINNYCSQLLFNFAHNLYHRGFSQILLTTFVQIFCSQLMFTTYVHNFIHNFLQNFCSKNLLKTFVHIFWSQLLFSHFLLTKLVHKSCSQLFLKTFVHNFCSQLLFTTLFLKVETVYPGACCLCWGSWGGVK